MDLTPDFPNNQFVLGGATADTGIEQLAGAARTYLQTGKVQSQTTMDLKATIVLDGKTQTDVESKLVVTLTQVMKN